MRSYPAEYRHRVIALIAEGMSSVEIAEVLGASSSWVDSIRRLHESGQPLEPKSRANCQWAL
ncbi:MAG TPA: helix-turn-helix domain-containing protein [Fimbriiglobus sp.]|jgi:transposase-like protein